MQSHMQLPWHQPQFAIWQQLASRCSGQGLCCLHPLVLLPAGDSTPSDAKRRRGEPDLAVASDSQHLAGSYAAMQAQQLPLGCHPQMHAMPHAGVY